jgi:hypothetical protein
MQIRRESLGWEEKLVQRQAVLRALTVVNLQIGTLADYICRLEDQICHMQGETPAKRREPASPLSN